MKFVKVLLEDSSGRALPADVMDLIDAGRWADAYSKLVSSDDINLFLDTFIDRYKRFEPFKEQIEKIKAPLKRELMGMGERAFQEETNPILAFLPQYFSLSPAEFTEEDFKKLLSLWSNGIIDDKDLRKKSPADHIIYNDNLYKMNQIEFIVQAYEWLSNKKNVSYYIDLNNPNAGELEDNLKRICGDLVRDTLGRFKHKNTNAFRDLIIYKTFDDPSGEITPADEIQARLRRLQDRAPGKQTKEDDEETTKTRPVRYNKEDVNKVFTDGPDKLNKETVNVLLNYLKDKGYIR